MIVGETEQVRASSPLPCAAVRRLKRDSRPLNEFPFLSDLARLVVESSEVRERSGLWKMLRESLLDVCIHLLRLMQPTPFEEGNRHDVPTHC